MSAQKNKTEKDYTGQEYIITRDFDAPRELVFKAWTDPEHLEQWWGPRGFTNPVCDWDARPGKKIYVVMRAPNGVDYPMGGAFQEVVAPERLVFTSGALDGKGKLLFEFSHTVTFAERKGKTTLTIKSRVTKTTTEANKYIGGFEAGMTQSLEKLAGYLSQKSRSKNKTDAPKCEPDREIVISRVVNAPRELVWEAITNPNHVTHWWGPRGFTTTTEKMEFRPGGVWKHVMHGPDGTDYPNKSVFKEIVKPERIVYVHDGRKKGGPAIQFEMTWSFDVLKDGKTKVTIRQVYPTSAMRDMVAKEYGAIEGAKQTLARLDDWLAKRAGKN